FLSDLRAESPRGTIHIEFENPFSGTEEERETKRAALEDKAIFPIQLSVHNTDGSHSSQLIYPVALVSDGTQQIAVPLLQGWTGEAPDQTLHQSIENLEYAFVSAIRKLSRGRRPVIGFTEGNGELNDTELHDVLHRLADAFQVGRINLNKINFDGL